MITVDAKEFIERLKNADSWFLKHADTGYGRYVLFTSSEGGRGTYMSPNPLPMTTEEYRDFVEELGAVMESAEDRFMSLNEMKEHVNV